MDDTSKSLPTIKDSLNFAIAVIARQALVFDSISVEQKRRILEHVKNLKSLLPEDSK